MDRSLNDPNGVSGSISAAAGSMIALTTIAVPLRLLSRYMSKHAGYWWDDWLLVTAYLLLLIFEGLTLGMAANGFGSHIGTVTKPHLLKAELYLYIGQLFYNVGLTLLKLSVLLFYVRVFTLRKPWFKGAIGIVGGLCIAWAFGISFMAAFKCRPVQKAFNPTLPGSCINYNITIYATAVSNTVIDVFILILPVPHLWTLQTSRAKRAGLGVVFLFGYGVLGLSVGRLVVGIQDGESTSTDFTYVNANTAVLTVLEGGIGTISVCLPALLHLLRRLRSVLRNKSWASSVSSSLCMPGSSQARMGPVANPIEPGYLDHKQYENISLADISRATNEEQTPV